MFSFLIVTDETHGELHVQNVVKVFAAVVARLSPSEVSEVHSNWWLISLVDQLSIKRLGGESLSDCATDVYLAIGVTAFLVTS